MPNPLHPPSERAIIAERRHRVAALYLQGRTQWEIARTVQRSQGTICTDLKAIEAEWLRSAVMDVNARKARELAKVDRVEREAYRGWRRSLKNAEKTRKKAIDAGDGQRKEAETISEGQAGDPRFLQIVMSCIERRCKLLGADAPQKKELSGHVDFSRYSEADLDLLESLALRAQTVAESGGNTVREGPASASLGRTIPGEGNQAMPS